MARYFFHLRDGADVALDLEGVELPSLDVAQKMAVEGARDSLSHDIRTGRIDISLRIDVENDDGRVLLSVPFRDAFDVTGSH
jgi:hypothetical protein